jgi:hypothetical protein
MTEYLVVVSHPKQFEYHGPFDELDAAYADGAALGHDDWEMGDVQSDGVHLRFGKSRGSAMPDAQSFKIVPLPGVQRRVNLDPEMARFLRDGACRR